MKKIGITILLMFVTMSMVAQVQVEAKMDSIMIYIGQQAHLTVNVTSKRGSTIVFPTFKRSQPIVPGVEVLSSNDADTMSLDDDLVKVSKTFTLTSFDEHLYAIPGLKVKVAGKLYNSNPLALKVLTLDVDTLHPNKFFPPKDVQDNPFSWNEWSLVFWLSVLMLCVCSIIFYLIICLRQNKPIMVKIRIVKKILPHQKALGVINQIKEDHMVSSENQKEYYTKLTDTLREYIKERFGFNAMEMTSSEIISRLQSADDRKMIDELRELFMTADLVKFAKYSTLINENDLNLVNAINFIDQTKLDDVPTVEKIVPNLSEDEARTKKTRVTLKTLIYVFIGIAIILLLYVIYNCVQLLQ